MSRSLPNFLIFLVGVMVVMAGMMVWFTARDYDQHFYYETTYDEQPSFQSDLGYYEDMSPDQQAIVDGAINGKNYVFGDDAKVPPPLVKKGGKYYKFVSFKTFDWSDPEMMISMLIICLGGVVTLEGIRREQFPNMDLKDVKYYMPFIGGK